MQGIRPHYEGVTRNLSMLEASASQAMCRDRPSDRRLKPSVHITPAGDKGSVHITGRSQGIRPHYMSGWSPLQLENLRHPCPGTRNPSTFDVFYPLDGLSCTRRDILSACFNKEFDHISSKRSYPQASFYKEDVHFNTRQASTFFN